MTGDREITMIRDRRKGECDRRSWMTCLRPTFAENWKKHAKLLRNLGQAMSLKKTTDKGTNSRPIQSSLPAKRQCVRWWSFHPRTKIWMPLWRIFPLHIWVAGVLCHAMRPHTPRIAHCRRKNSQLLEPAYHLCWTHCLSLTAFWSGFYCSFQQPMHLLVIQESQRSFQCQAHYITSDTGRNNNWDTMNGDV